MDTVNISDHIICRPGVGWYVFAGEKRVGWADAPEAATRHQPLVAHAKIRQLCIIYPNEVFIAVPARLAIKLGHIV